ncbi:MAG TPA: phosphoenolpyruvate-protein phosphotransferase PtsP, partial [Pseudomonas sp.]|nr:phosphoenolpyruvate-protein phosphotransferase PtsP [Pseudomonas sp.]
GEGKPVSICGEMAGDPAAAMLLLAMGFDSLSMNATNLPKVKWLLRQISMDTAQQLLARVMLLDSPQVIHSTVQLTLRNLGLNKLINPSAAV